MMAVAGGKLLLADAAVAGSVLWQDGGGLRFYRQAEVYLGTFNGVDCVAWRLDPAVLDAPQITAVGLRSLLFAAPESVFSLAARAVQLLDWQEHHQFCGRCGEATQRSDNDLSRHCPACELLFYPRISPCVITVIIRDDHCLLARAPQWEEGWFSALAGFVEAGESAEQALHREVYEEVGLHIHNQRYIGSQAWPFPGQLMLGFLADYAAGEIILCEEELAEADWWRFDRLPRVPNDKTMSGRLIAAFVREAEARFR